MPMDMIANRFEMADTQNMYQFFEENRNGWSVFWEELGGDKAKILKWATDSEVDSPEAWYNELYKFLFGNYSGDVNLLHKEAKKASFSDFLSKAAENHIKMPKDKMWYVDQGISKREFIAQLQRAADVGEELHAVEYLNARVRDWGNRLYDEYLLSLTGWLETVKEATSAINRRAYELVQEVDAGGFVIGDTVRYAFNDENVYEVKGVVDGQVITADVDDGIIVCFDDVWNLQKVEAN